jgi:hypothetical protein
MKTFSNTVYNFICADREMLAKGGSYSFRTYNDKVGAYGDTPGMDVIFDDGTRDKRGVPTGKAFTLNQSHYNLQARETQTDVNKRKLVDFFLNHPACEGSPNGDYQTADGEELSPKEIMNREQLVSRIKTGEVIQTGVKFRLLDTAKDAKVKLEVGKRRAEAQVSASNLDEQTLKEVAAHIGVFGEPDDLMRDQVFEWAGKKPIDYFNLLQAGDRAIRAIIRRSLSERILTTKGTSIYFQNTLIGSNEDTAVSTLQSDKNMLDALQEQSGLNTQVKAQKPKK